MNFFFHFSVSDLWGCNIGHWSLCVSLWCNQGTSRRKNSKALFYFFIISFNILLGIRHSWSFPISLHPRLLSSILFHDDHISFSSWSTPASLLKILSCTLFPWILKKAYLVACSMFVLEVFSCIWLKWISCISQLNLIFPFRLQVDTKWL